MSSSQHIDSLSVRDTAAWIVEHATHVKLIHSKVLSAAEGIVQSFSDIKQQAAGFDEELHFCDHGPLTAQYLLVVDALNFCFWPDGEFEYEHLAGGLKSSLLSDPHCLSAQRLAAITGPQVRDLLHWPRDLPQQEERARLLREIGGGLLQHYDGQASQLVSACQQSAVRLVQLLTAHFPGFRDHAVYKGRQVFFYKRAQIFVGDLYGAFRGQGLGSFHDIQQLTMFADYRVPVVLRLMGVLQYEQQLAQQVDSQTDLLAGSEQEIEIRAASIVAVELLKEAANKQLQHQHVDNCSSCPDGLQSAADTARQQQEQQQHHRHHQQQERQERQLLDQLTHPPSLLSIQLDWWLWHEGEKMRAQHPPHHRTWTIYY